MAEVSQIHTGQMQTAEEKRRALEAIVRKLNELIRLGINKGDPGDPGPGVPTGGSADQVLTKKSLSDFDTEWADPVGSDPELPVGGTAAQVLAKVSSADFDVEWADAASSTPELPAGGTVGQVLAKASATDYDVEWVDAAAGAGGSSLLDLIFDEVADATEEIDKLIVSGDYRIFIYFTSHNAAGWKSATNATFLIPSGKSLVVLYWIASYPVAYDDGASRQARLANSAAGALVSPGDFRRFHTILWQGDLTAIPQITQAAGPDTFTMQVWNVDAQERSMGGAVICKLIDTPV